MEGVLAEAAVELAKACPYGVILIAVFWMFFKTYKVTVEKLADNMEKSIKEIREAHKDASNTVNNSLNSINIANQSIEKAQNSINGVSQRLESIANRLDESLKPPTRQK